PWQASVDQFLPVSDYTWVGRGCPRPAATAGAARRIGTTRRRCRSRVMSKALIRTRSCYASTIVSAPASCAHSSAARSAARLLLTGSRCHFGELVILIEKKLLPPSLDEAQRIAAMRAQMHQRRGENGHVVAVVRGQEGWVQQLGNEDGLVHYAVIERRCRPALPQRTHRRMASEPP